jgi:hypothetical protein
VRRIVNEHVTKTAGEWAGAPLPLEDIKLVVEPRYPFQGLNGMQFDKPGDSMETPIGREISREFGDCNSIFPINVLHDSRNDTDVWIYHEGDGRSKIARLSSGGPGDRFEFAVRTMSAARAWSLEAEFTAMEKLKELVTPVAFKYYVTTGSFLETSQRSGVTYFFRRVRPTIAIKQDVDGDMRILAALCLHPIGYYEKTFAGVMVPTDDVIAHLLMMRGDEHRFWSKANHHDLRSIECGL